jgi:tRNA threonylcarbamoyladenosine biosynthesis protein TsaB
MKILALDSSTDYFCLGLSDGKRHYLHNLRTRTLLSKVITVIIKRVIEAAGIEIADFDYFACGIGPGSFTGLRVGVATIKGLAWAANKPVISIPTLDILALNFDRGDGIVVPAVDAKRGLIYCCIYELKNNKLRKLSPYMLLSAAEFCRKVKSGSYILGDALELYKDEFRAKIKRANLLDKDYWYPRAEKLLAAAESAVKSRKGLTDAFKIKPLYLYPRDCQIRKK